MITTVLVECKNSWENVCSQDLIDMFCSNKYFVFPLKFSYSQQYWHSYSFHGNIVSVYGNKWVSFCTSSLIISCNECRWIIHITRCCKFQPMIRQILLLLYLFMVKEKALEFAWAISQSISDVTRLGLVTHRILRHVSLWTGEHQRRQVLAGLLAWSAG